MTTKLTGTGTTRSPDGLTRAGPVTGRARGRSTIPTWHSAGRTCPARPATTRHPHPGGWRTWSADGPERRPADTPGRRTTHGRSAVVGGPAGIPLIPTGAPATAERPSDTRRSRRASRDRPDPPQGRIRPMRILLWHGYLLGGTGLERLHPCARARVEPRGARRDRAQPGAASRGVRPRRGRDGAPGRRTGSCPSSCSTATRATRRSGCPTRRASASAVGRRERRRRARAPARRLRLRQPRPAGRPRRGSRRRAVRRQGARLRARVRDARQRGAVGVGRGGAGRRPRDGRRLRAHPHGRRGGVRSHRTASPRCRRGRRRPLAPGGAGRRPRGLLGEAALDPPNPGNADERLPDEGNAGRLEAFLAADRPTVVYFGKLIPQKGVDVLLRSLRGLDARAVIVGFGPERAALEALAAARASRRCSPGRSSTATFATCWRSPTPASCPSVFPEAFGMVAAEAAAAGCPPIVARHSGLAEIAAGLEEATAALCAQLVSSPTGDVGALHDRLATCSRCAGRARGPCGRRAAGGRGAGAGRASRRGCRRRRAPTGPRGAAP